ncbi:MAG: ATP-binding protein [Lachnospiraceae bacterium]|nr:ATP-binding protein [Lachnospiraceae bacterium]
MFMLQGGKFKKDVISSMFLPAAVTMIFTQMTGVVANIIDGIITSRFLGEDAYSAVSLLGPMVNIILLLAGFISIGGQIVCAQKVGKGERDEASAIFTFSVLFGIVIALLFVLLSVVSPEMMFRICGVSLDERPELYEHMLRYLNGYVIGIPAVVMVQVLSPFVVMDNGKRLVTAASVVLCAADIAGDLANVLVFNGGIYGMGVATSAAMWLQLAAIMIYFAGRSRYFRVTMRAFSFSHLKDIVKDGSLTFVKRLATILRDIATNRINLFVAVSTAAIAARGMQSDLNTLLFCIGMGIGRTLLTMASMYYGASDRKGLERVFAYSLRLSMVITAAVGVLLFVFAPFISKIYTDDPEVIELSVFSIRCMAIGLPMDSFTEILQDYLQGIQNRRLMNILCFSERFFIPVAMAFVLGMIFGSKGIMASLAVGKVLLILTLAGFLWIRNKAVPIHAKDYMFLPDGFGGREDDNFTSEIQTMEDAVKESRKTVAFCRSHGVDDRRAKLMALFVEEMAGNIVTHGKPRGRNKVCVDFRLYANQGKIGLSLRDYCEAFDLMKYYEINKENDSEDNIGIRMVMGLAEDIRYINTFNSNCLLIAMSL